MELEGTLQVERPPTRRWIPIVGAVIPVVAFVAVAAWFIRAFVAPPMVTIPAPGALMAEPPSASSMARGDVADANRAIADRGMPARPVTQIDAPMQQPAAPAPAQLASLSSSSASAPVGSPFPPVAAPPVTASPFPEPAQSPSAMAAVNSQPADAPNVADIEPGEPIKGPIPLPQPRPSVRFAQAVVSGAVPLPRPRPAEITAKPEAAEPDQPDRHNIQ
jgi:hypothetical protein